MQYIVTGAAEHRDSTSQPSGPAGASSTPISSTGDTRTVPVGGVSTSGTGRVGGDRGRGHPRGRDVFVAAFQQSNRDAAAVVVRRCFYLCDLPFHLAMTPAWRDMMRAVSRIGAEWEGPSMQYLRTRELYAER